MQATMTKHRTTAARKSLERARRLPLVAAALAIFGPTGAHAGNLPVTSCTDAGPTDIGNLRHVVAAAGNGDTVDMTGLSCSTITLLLGEIVIQQDTLAIKGPGEYTLAIDAQQSRVFNHAGSGTPAITPTLTVSDLTMAYGYANEASSPANRGGCVYAKGNVALHNVYV